MHCRENCPPDPMQAALPQCRHISHCPTGHVCSCWAEVRTVETGSSNRKAKVVGTTPNHSEASLAPLSHFCFLRMSVCFITLLFVSFFSCMLVFRQTLNRNSRGTDGTGERGRCSEKAQSPVSNNWSFNACSDTHRLYMTPGECFVNCKRLGENEWFICSCSAGHLSTEPAQRGFPHITAAPADILLPVSSSTSTLGWAATCMCHIETTLHTCLPLPSPREKPPSTKENNIWAIFHNRSLPCFHR